MTFTPELVCPSQIMVDPGKRHVIDFLRIRGDALFSPSETDEYSAMAKIHFLIKRLGQSYETIIGWPKETFDYFYKVEMELFEKENSENNPQIS